MTQSTQLAGLKKNKIALYTRQTGQNPLKPVSLFQVCAHSAAELSRGRTGFLVMRMRLTKSNMAELKESQVQQAEYRWFFRSKKVKREVLKSQMQLEE